MDSARYYDDNAEAFYQRTINTDVTYMYTKFLRVVNKPAKILDAGCGSGRDAKYFLTQGYDVEAFDASKEMVRIASRETGKSVKHHIFHDVCQLQEFDAIWANASLLHVPYEELQVVLLKFHRALKEKGMLFASFKYGNSRRQVGDRVFFDYSERTILPHLNYLFQPIDIEKVADTRSSVAPSPDAAWLHILCRAI